MKPLFLTLVGPPGAGKGTQAQILCETFGLGYLSTGEMMRQAAQAPGPEGDQLREYASSGHLAPDDFTNAMVARRLDDMPAGCLLDGYPRTLDQAQALDEQLAFRDWKLSAALHLRVPDSVIRSRLLGRRICPACGSSYHLQFRPPSTSGRCDADDVQLTQRADDVAEKIERRITAYHQLTEPLIAFYTGSSRLITVDASADVDDVRDALVDEISRLR